MSLSKAKKILHATTYSALALIEKSMAREFELRYSPTFLVGPPRSGTTLTMQLLTWAVPTCYFNNMTSSSLDFLGYPLPTTTAILAKLLKLTKAPPSYKSRFGYSHGRGRSTEGIELWTYWFGTRNIPISPSELTNSQKKQIHQAVAATEHVFGLPFVNKTVDLSLRIRALAEIFPSALFIHIHRDPLDIAQSLYKIRIALTTRDWFGPKPKECEGRSQDSLAEQICRQIYFIEKNISHERSIVGEKRFLSVSYKEMCSAPQHQLSKIAAFMNDNGAPARLCRSVPTSFQLSTGRNLGMDEYQEIKACVKRLWGSSHY